MIRKKTKIEGNIIYKYLNNSKTYFRIKKLYNKTLHSFDFVPRMKFNDKKLEIKEDYIKNVLSRKNKPKNYKQQLINIYKMFRKNNLYHNELLGEHIRVKGDKIFIIDFDQTYPYKTNSVKASQKIKNIIARYSY